MSFLRQITRPQITMAFAATAAISLGVARYSLTLINNEAQKTFVGDDQWIDLKLVDKKSVSHDVALFTFALPTPEASSGLTTASALMAKFVTPKGNNVIRPYTPVSEPAKQGQIELLVKYYEQGKLSKHIHNLKPDDTLSFKGPIVKWKWQPNQFKEITLIGGGSGITPFYQLLREIANNPDDKTKVNLIYGNRTPEDVLIKEQLDKLAENGGDRIKIHYFVDQPTDDWKHHTGHVTKSFLEENMPPPSDDTKVFVCGPPGMYEAISGNKVSPSDQGELTGILKEMNFKKEHVFKF